MTFPITPVPPVAWPVACMTALPLNPALGVEPTGRSIQTLSCSVFCKERTTWRISSRTSLVSRFASSSASESKYLLEWDRAGIQQQLRAYGGRHNGETDRENRASLDRLERTTKDVCFLVSILQVREQVVSFYVLLPRERTECILIALIVSTPCHASMDGLSLPSSSSRDHSASLTHDLYMYAYKS